jgi:hypothetical protein
MEPGEVSVHIRQSTGEAFQDLSADSQSNPQNTSGMTKIIRKIGPL